MKFKIHYPVFIIAVLCTLYSCKKSKIDTELMPTKNGTRAQLTKDSIFLYAQQVYLWNTELPTYGVFNPRKYSTASSDLDNFNNLLFNITRYGINPLNGKPYEYNFDFENETKYSYIEDLVANGSISSINDKKKGVNLHGEGDDIGYGLTVVGPKNNYAVYIRYVSPGSPAQAAGLKRGDYFNQINGLTFGTNYDAEINNIDNEVNKNTVTIIGKKKNGTPFNITLSKAYYISSPIYKDTVINAGGKKIGYLAYARFSDNNNSIPALDNVFANFTTAGVTDLIIDLRYNGGGYISSAEHLINLIAPTRLNNLLMFSEHFNQTMQNNQASILLNQPDRNADGSLNYDGNGKLITLANYSYKPAENSSIFAKLGNLQNIENVVFIISGSTASASELVINCLKPYINVKTVGTTSYGKPVGFFPIRIDKYDVYYSMFSTKNSAGEGNYFAGMVPTTVIKDDATKEFGDITENNLGTAIAVLTNTSVANSALRTMQVKGKLVPSSSINVIPLNDNSFKGMIEKVRKR